MSMYTTAEHTEPEEARNGYREQQDPRPAEWLAQVEREDAQRTRTERAILECSQYEFGQVRNAQSFPYVTHGGDGLCVGLRSVHGLYIVDEAGTCSCPDSKNAAKALGVRCKHAEAARLLGIWTTARAMRAARLAKQQWKREEEAAEEQARRARVQRDKEALFGDAIAMDREYAAARR